MTIVYLVMKKIQISTFKAECLRLLDEVSRTKESLTVTRHGKPLVVINPSEEHQQREREGFGIAKGTIEIKENIIEPATDLSDWEVLN